MVTTMPEGMVDEFNIMRTSWTLASVLQATLAHPTTRYREGHKQLAAWQHRFAIAPFHPPWMWTRLTDEQPPGGWPPARDLQHIWSLSKRLMGEETSLVVDTLALVRHLPTTQHRRFPGGYLALGQLADLLFGSHDVWSSLEWEDLLEKLSEAVLALLSSEPPAIELTAVQPLHQVGGLPRWELVRPARLLPCESCFRRPSPFLGLHHFARRAPDGTFVLDSLCDDVPESYKSRGAGPVTVAVPTGCPRGTALHLGVGRQAGCSVNDSKHLAPGVRDVLRGAGPSGLSNSGITWPLQPWSDTDVAAWPTGVRWPWLSQYTQGWRVEFALAQTILVALRHAPDDIDWRADSPVLLEQLAHLGCTCNQRVERLPEEAVLALVPLSLVLLLMARPRVLELDHGKLRACDRSVTALKGPWTHYYWEAVAEGCWEHPLLQLPDVAQWSHPIPTWFYAPLGRPGDLQPRQPGINERWYLPLRELRSSPFLDALQPPQVRDQLLTTPSPPILTEAGVAPGSSRPHWDVPVWVTLPTGQKPPGDWPLIDCAWTLWRAVDSSTYRIRDAAAVLTFVRHAGWQLAHRRQGGFVECGQLVEWLYAGSYLHPDTWQGCRERVFRAVWHLLTLNPPLLETPIDRSPYHVLGDLIRPSRFASTGWGGLHDPHPTLTVTAFVCRELANNPFISGELFPPPVLPAADEREPVQEDDLVEPPLPELAETVRGAGPSRLAVVSVNSASLAASSGPRGVEHQGAAIDESGVGNERDVLDMPIPTFVVPPYDRNNPHPTFSAFQSIWAAMRSDHPAKAWSFEQVLAVVIHAFESLPQLADQCLVVYQMSARLRILQLKLGAPWGVLELAAVASAMRLSLFIRDSRSETSFAWDHGRLKADAFFLLVCDGGWACQAQLTKAQLRALRAAPVHWAPYWPTRVRCHRTATSPREGGSDNTQTFLLVAVDELEASFPDPASQGLTTETGASSGPRGRGAGAHHQSNLPWAVILRNRPPGTVSHAAANILQCIWAQLYLTHPARTWSFDRAVAVMERALGAAFPIHPLIEAAYGCTVAARLEQLQAGAPWGLFEVAVLAGALQFTASVHDCRTKRTFQWAFGDPAWPPVMLEVNDRGWSCGREETTDVQPTSSLGAGTYDACWPFAVEGVKLGAIQHPMGEPGHEGASVFIQVVDSSSRGAGKRDCALTLEDWSLCMDLPSHWLQPWACPVDASPDAQSWWRHWMAGPVTIQSLIDVTTTVHSLCLSCDPEDCSWALPPRVLHALGAFVDTLASVNQLRQRWQLLAKNWKDLARFPLWLGQGRHQGGWVDVLRVIRTHIGPFLGPVVPTLAFRLHPAGKEFRLMHHDFASLREIFITMREFARRVDAAFEEWLSIPPKTRTQVFSPDVLDIARRARCALPFLLLGGISDLPSQAYLEALASARQRILLLHPVAYVITGPWHRGLFRGFEPCRSCGLPCERHSRAGFRHLSPAGG